MVIPKMCALPPTVGAVTGDCSQAGTSPPNRWHSGSATSVTP